MSNPDGTLEAIDASLRDYSVSVDAMRCAPTPKPAEVRLQEALGVFGELAEQARQAFEAVAKEMAPILTGIERGFHKAGWQGDRAHYRRCPTCNPRGFPKPLPVNGHEYHRRQRRRNRR